ncbi:PQQ-like beta-propeller repeat protein [Myxococcota bacterium]|nr:PQQ-like beta-propeller repeat protein [Myxococcota bacterium]
MRAAGRSLGLLCLTLGGLACETGGGAPGEAAGGRAVGPDAVESSAAEDDVPDRPALDASAGPTLACEPLGRPPYTSAPYQGVHAGPGNNDLVACTTAPAYTQRWHALQGYGVAQPNTFSADLTTIYVTTTRPTPDACTLHALDAATGETRWCAQVPDAVGASADVDADGHLYLAAKGAVVSFTADGARRWSFPLDAAEGEAAFGSHFDPEGLLVTATSAGRLLFLDRADGHAVASLDLVEAFGLERPPPAPALGLADLLPPAIRSDMERVYGEGEALLAIFGGAGAGYTDNTVGIGPDGSVYVIGWGVAEGSGAVVQVRVDRSGGAPALVPGWRMDTVKGSASSPAISPDGRWLKITDGNATPALLAPAAFPGSAKLADIAACDANTDADPDPAVCAPAVVLPLASGPALGASPVLDDAEHYQWEVQLATLVQPNTVPDIARYHRDTLIWATDLPDDAAWTSVLTVTRDAIIGTSSRFTAGDTRILGVSLPETATHELVVLDRQTGAVRFTAPLTDDSTSTVTVGPDGALYANLLGLVSAFTAATPITGGVVRFDPAEAAPAPMAEPAPPSAAPGTPARPIPSTGPLPPVVGAPWQGGGFPGSAPPAHPFMAPDGRSNIHNDGHMTDAYDRPGPRGLSPAARSARLGGLCGTVTFDARGRVMTVCASPEGATLFLLDPATLATLAEYALPPRPAAAPGQNPLQDFTGGGYFYLDAQDRAVVSTGAQTIEIVAVREDAAGAAPRFELERRLDLSDALPEGERLTGTLPDASGRLWFIGRDAGVIGVVEAGEPARIQTLTLGERVQNSFAVDADGGVFVVSDRALHRLEAPAGGPPVVVFREVYPNTGVRKPGQADAGSGTTPTLVEGGFVAITDNADPIDVVVYHRGATHDGPREVCRVPVFEPGASATENSLITSGRSLFVENNFGYEGVQSVTGQTTAPGFARIDIRADASGCDLVWQTGAVSAPSVVPKLSRATGLLYTYTKGAGSDAWFFTALDAERGDVAWQAPVGVGPAFNNNYAGLAIGPDGALYLGVLLGLVRLSDGAM